MLYAALCPAPRQCSLLIIANYARDQWLTKLEKNGIPHGEFHTATRSPFYAWAVIYLHQEGSLKFNPLGDGYPCPPASQAAVNDAVESFLSGVTLATGGKPVRSGTTSPNRPASRIPVVIANQRTAQPDIGLPGLLFPGSFAGQEAFFLLVPHGQALHPYGGWLHTCGAQILTLNQGWARVSLGHVLVLDRKVNVLPVPDMDFSTLPPAQEWTRNICLCGRTPVLALPPLSTDAMLAWDSLLVTQGVARVSSWLTRRMPLTDTTLSFCILQGVAPEIASGIPPKGLARQIPYEVKGAQKRTESLGSPPFFPVGGRRQAGELPEKSDPSPVPDQPDAISGKILWSAGHPALITREAPEKCERWLKNSSGMVRNTPWVCRTVDGFTVYGCYLNSPPEVIPDPVLSPVSISNAGLVIGRSQRHKQMVFPSFPTWEEWDRFTRNNKTVRAKSRYHLAEG